MFTENANKVYRYGQISAENFTPYPKNPIIANFFSNISRADELGSGVRNLYKYTKIYAGGEPFLFEDDVFRIEVPIYEKPIKADKKLIKADKSTLTENEKRCLNTWKNTAVFPIRRREIF